MTILGLIQVIKEDHFFDLNKWQKQFIEDMYEGVEGIPNDADDFEVREYLTEKQIEKVYEIAEELGIN